MLFRSVIDSASARGPACDSRPDWLQLLAGGSWNVTVLGKELPVVPSRCGVENGAEETGASC